MDSASGSSSSSRSVAAGTFVTRFRQCFMWCPLSCRGFYGQRRAASSVGAEHLTPPLMTPRAIWASALLEASELEDGSSVVTGARDIGSEPASPRLEMGVADVLGEAKAPALLGPGGGSSGSGAVASAPATSL